MIDCHKCKHYYVTWDPNFPHGCRAMGFKSLEFPSSVVFKSSGMNCLLFEPKGLKHRDIKAKDPDESVV